MSELISEKKILIGMSILYLLIIYLVIDFISANYLKVQFIEITNEKIIVKGILDSKTVFWDEISSAERFTYKFSTFIGIVRRKDKPTTPIGIIRAVLRFLGVYYIVIKFRKFENINEMKFINTIEDKL